VNLTPGFCLQTGYGNNTFDFAFSILVTTIERKTVGINNVTYSKEIHRIQQLEVSFLVLKTWNMNGSKNTTIGRPNSLSSAANVQNKFRTLQRGLGDR
jgi:hypothetical protein